MWSGLVAWGVATGLAWGGPGAPEPVRGLDPAVVAPAVVDGRRVALIVGNGRYRHATTLPQAPRDAEAIARALQGLGFTTELVLDADQRAMSRAIADFERTARGAEAGIFYYAGHAVQIEGANYLIPVDTDLEDPGYADADAIDARKVQRALEASGAPVAVLVLDACRNNPFASQWSGASRSFGSRGLAQMATRGLLIAYSTNPGNVAQDSGVYAHALAGHLGRSCQSLMDAFYLVRDEVLAATSGTQVPWIGGSPGIAFSRYQPAGCPDGASPAPVVIASPPAEPPVVDPTLTLLRRRLEGARSLYDRRCVDDLGPVSTAQERQECHARHHPTVVEAQQALDEYLLDHPEVGPR